ncbi:MAG: glycosyltransferase family 39 protein [Flavobacteriaceae bacterium]|nr:glycosyltransferase family 39 protein [Flavobacteriaceae bacterium]
MISNKIQKNLLLGAVIYITVNLLQSFLMPLINDEAYYWVWAQNLDWGYFDHPPMVALWIKAGFALFQNELGVRLISVLAGAAGYYLLGQMLEIQNDKQYWLYNALFFSMILFQAFGFVTTPDAPLLFFGILYFIVLKKFLEKSNFQNAILLGLVMALLLYSKYHGILLIIFSLLPLTLKLIRNKFFWLAVFFGILCYSPHLWWQFDNNFVSAEYHLVRRNVFNRFKISNTTDYLLSVIWASSPLLFWFHGKALFKTKYKTDFQKALIGGFLGIIAFFILITFKRYIQGQWSLLAFIPLIIITFEFFKNKLKDIKKIQTLGWITLVLIIVARIYFIIQDVPYKTQYHGWKDFMQRAGEVTSGTAVFEKYQYTSLFNFYNYPNKTAENYISIENRKSQYEIWNSEAKLNAKNITYFSHWLDVSDSLTVDSRDQEVFKYKNISHFLTPVNLQIHVKDSIIKQNNFQFTAEIRNSGDFTVECTRANQFSLEMAYVEFAYSEDIKCVKELAFTDFVLAPGEVKDVVVSGQICDLPAGDYIGYLGFVNQHLPIKKQSNYLEIKID